jgi:hypothetical protein
MTPKEKAIELVDKMYATQGPENGITEDEAKQCALIAVDEIIKYRPRYPNNVDWTDCDASYKNYYDAQREQAKNYWQEVKQEIENL